MGGLNISAINGHIETNGNGNKASVYLLDLTFSLLHSRQCALHSRRVSSTVKNLVERRSHAERNSSLESSCSSRLG